MYCPYVADVGQCEAQLVEVGATAQVADGL